MDPLGDFVDVLARAPAARDEGAVLFDPDALLRLLVDARPKAVIVHGRGGSGRTTLALTIRGLLYEHRLCQHVVVDDEHEHTVVSSRTMRRVVEAALARAADALTIFVTMPSKVCVPSVLSVGTRDAMSGSALRAAYGIGVERLMRLYNGSLVKLHNHRVHGIAADTARRPAEHAEHDPDAASYADVLVGKSRLLELDADDALLAECALLLLRGGPHGDKRRHDRQRQRRREATHELAVPRRVQEHRRGRVEALAAVHDEHQRSQRNRHGEAP